MPFNLTVGQPFPIQLRGELFLRFVGGTLMFIQNIDAPTKVERKLFQDGALDAGLYVHASGLAFLVIRFVGKKITGQWMDTPIHFSQNDEAELGEFFSKCNSMENQTEKTAPLGLCLVDANNGILQELRMIGPPPSFFLKLKEIFKNQAADDVIYDEAYIQSQIYAKMSSEEMAHKAQERFFIKRN